MAALKKYLIPAFLVTCGMVACVSIISTPEEPLTSDGKERPTYKTDPNFAIRSNCQTFPSGVNERQLFGCATAAWDRAHYTALVVAKNMSSTREIRKECFGFNLPEGKALAESSKDIFTATRRCLSATEESIREDSMSQHARDMGTMVRLARSDIEEGFSRLPEALRP